MASPPARARRRHAVERDHVARRQSIGRSASGLVPIRSSPYTLACTVKSGRARVDTNANGEKKREKKLVGLPNLACLATYIGY